MTGIIDFHTHVFPDELAKNAVPYLEQEGNVKAHLNGTVASLLASMDKAGVEKSVICSIATKPSQFSSILSWSKEIRSERLIPFPSFHPADSNVASRIRQIKAEGFKGIKMHPYYQDFYLDEERLMRAYEVITEENLILVMHTGFDIAFPRTRLADPERIMNVITRFPEMKLVTTHLGAWELWDEVSDILAGKQVYMDISYTLDQLDKEKAREIIFKHSGEHLLFATDSPWSSQQETYEMVKGLKLGDKLEKLILRENALKLLNSVT